MKLVKCPECHGKGEYEVEEYFEGKLYLPVFTCSCCAGIGKISWSHFCTVFRKRSAKDN